VCVGTDVKAPGESPGRQRWPYRSAVVVVLVGALATGGLAAASAALNSSNENRLLKLRAKEVASLITSALPNIQTPLASAAALADVTGANRSRFERLVMPYVGSGPSSQFVSMSLWQTGDVAAGPALVVGAPLELTPSPPGTAAFFARASRSRGLTVIGMLGGTHPRLGYAFSGPYTGRFVAYGESALPASRVTPIPPGDAYSDLEFAIYLGRSARSSQLLLATVLGAHLSSPRTKLSVPFGDTELTFVISPHGPLGGTLPSRLPWVLGIIGGLLTLGACVFTLQLIRGRRGAQQLAEENRQLYAEQQGISQVLQHALLPDTLPELDGLELSARYEAGVHGIDVGGDWYDLISLDRDRLLLVIGDVSGRGLRAATSMASMRFAIHYAAQDDPPEVFLTKLSAMRRLTVNHQIATVSCAVINVRTREIRLTSAGHLPLLLVSDGRSEFVAGEVGLPIGVDSNPRYVSTTVIAPPGATLLGFTDGLIERRGEVIDDGLERLRRAAANGGGTLEEVVDRVLADVRGTDSEDDTVIAGMRWLS